MMTTIINQSWRCLRPLDCDRGREEDGDVAYVRTGDTAKNRGSLPPCPSTDTSHLLMPSDAKLAKKFFGERLHSFGVTNVFLTDDNRITFRIQTTLWPMAAEEKNESAVVRGGGEEG